MTLALLIDEFDGCLSLVVNVLGLQLCVHNPKTNVPFFDSSLKRWLQLLKNRFLRKESDWKKPEISPKVKRDYMLRYICSTAKPGHCWKMAHWACNTYTCYSFNTSSYRFDWFKKINIGIESCNVLEWSYSVWKAPYTILEWSLHYIWSLNYKSAANQRSFLYRAVSLWNSLPSQWRYWVR